MGSARPPVDDPSSHGHEAGARSDARRMVDKPLTMLRFGFMVAATGGILALLIGRSGSALLLTLLHTRRGWVAASLAMAGASVLLGALRWKIVLGAMSYRIGFGRALAVVLAAWPLAVVTPSRANDFARAFAIRGAVPIAAGTGSVLAEKVVDIAVLFALAWLGAAIEGLWALASLMLLGLAAELAIVRAMTAVRAPSAPGVAGGRWLRGRPALAKKVEELLVASRVLVRAPGRLVLACVVSLSIRLLTLGMTYALLRAADAGVGVIDTCALWPVATLVGLVPITLAGMGTRDAAFVYLLGLRGHLVTRASVLAATMAYSVIAVGLFAIIGLPFMVRESTRRRS
ncbi:MAG: lysylphosphatidylglycerol synthase transmembrane domain-containing protein [Polyangiaceae bacterium]